MGTFSTQWHRPDWETLARSLGMTYAVTDKMMPWAWDELRSMDGIVSGHPVHVAAMFGNAGHSQYTVVTIAMPPLQLALQIEPAGILSAVAHVFGAQDVEVGDAAFDEALVVRSTDPERATRLLAASTWLRSELAARCAQGRKFSIKDDGIRVELPDGPADAIGAEVSWGIQVATELRRAAGQSPAST